MGELPGIQDAAENEGAGVQAAGRACPPDQRWNGSNITANPSVCHRYPLHRCVNTKGFKNYVKFISLRCCALVGGVQNRPNQVSICRLRSNHLEQIRRQQSHKEMSDYNNYSVSKFAL